MVKCFCDVCGKEVDRLESTIHFRCKRYDICKKCEDAYHKMRNDLYTEGMKQFLKSKGVYISEGEEENEELH